MSAARCLPDTLFGRLALLLAAAVLVSHVLALTLMFELRPARGPHPAPPPAWAVPPAETPAPPLPPGLPNPPEGAPRTGPPVLHPGLLLDVGVRLGVLQGCQTYLLQDGDGQIEATHSVSAGLDYAAVGPEHAFYRERGRIEFDYATDAEVLETFQLCSRLEGIIPALESTHALAYGLKRARELSKDKVIIINLSGRGDKDVQQVAAMLGTQV